MRLALAFLAVAGLVGLIQALPFPSEEPQPGIPTSLLEEEQLSIQNNQQLNPLAREKRHKKKVVIVNQYYGRPGYGCRGCGSGGYYSGGGYPGGGWGYGNGGYDYYPGG